MNKKISIITILLIAGLLIILGITKMTNSPTKVLLKTNQGNIIIELATDMPITTGNFINLVKEGTYNGIIFHRVIDNFMIQGGDPTGTGYGDPSIPKIEEQLQWLMQVQILEVVNFL